LYSKSSLGADIAYGELLECPIMQSEEARQIGRPKPFKSILVGGGIAGALDGLDAVIFYYLAFGVTPALLFQHIATGLLGASAFREGWRTIGLGIGLQFLIAIGAAAVFYVAALVAPSLLRRPAIGGPAFGIVVYVVMHYVVVPLSAVTKRTVPVSTAEFVDQILSHMLFVGLPIALMARR
jgi:ABC-type transport system involved in multi-copper enzyme maturation permease subunit